MIIGLDWDNTFTLDYDFWQEFVTNANTDGHSVYITTSRGSDTPIEASPNDIEGTVYCNFNPKRWVTEYLHLKIDIWIDDDPQWIDKGFTEEHDLTHVGLHKGD